MLNLKFVKVYFFEHPSFLLRKCTLQKKSLSDFEQMEKEIR